MFECFNAALYLLLSDENLFRGDFDTHVTSGNHDTVGLRDDLVNVVHALLVLNLRDDLDLLPLFAKDLPDLADPSGVADERREDDVNAVLDAELQILDILGADCRL